MANFTCDTCGFSKAAPDEWVGRRAICPKCKQKTHVQPDAIAIADPNVFDESLTFAYKSDHLGMSRADFLRHHNDVKSSEFQIVSSQDISFSNYARHGFENWMSGETRLLQYSATGTRLTIVGFELIHGVYTFLDDLLSTIALTIKNPSENKYIDILPELYGALNDESENSSAGEISITTWTRPLGSMSLVYIPYEPAINVRYVNKETLDTFNRIRTRSTGSSDL